MKMLKTLVEKAKELLALKRYETARNLEMKYEAVKRSPVFILIPLIILSVFITVILQEIPHWQVSQFAINDSIAVAQLENNYRATLAQIIGGFALLLGLYFTWRNAVTAKESQIAELLTRAVDQLGNRNLEVRIGGIYALEKISIQSKKDHWSIMNILTAYIRKNSPIKKGEHELEILNYSSTESVSVDNLDIDKDSLQWETFDPFVSFDIEENPKRVSVDNLDLQAILTVIGRRKYSSIHGEPECLDICDVDLQGSNFFQANLESILFLGTNLKESNFIMANLKGAFLDFTDLRGARFTYANLQGAYLKSTDLRKAKLEYTNLRWVNFESSNLQGANLEKADLKGANLKETDLQGANLIGARNLSLDQLSKVKSIRGAKLDERLLTIIKEKYPSLLLKPKEIKITYNDERWGKMNEI